MEEDEDSFELEVFEVKDEEDTPDVERRVKKKRKKKSKKSSSGPQRSRSAISVCSSRESREPQNQPLVPPTTPGSDTARPPTMGGTPVEVGPNPASSRPSTLRASLLTVLGKLVWRRGGRHRAPPTPPQAAPSAAPLPADQCEYLRGFLGCGKLIIYKAMWTHG